MNCLISAGAARSCSYVMQPYTMVKDHRTNEESGNVDAVMNGAIDNFINAYLKWIALGNKKNS